MQAATLRTMAVAEISDFAIDLVLNAPALAVSGNHLSVPLAMSFLIDQAARKAPT